MKKLKGLLWVFLGLCAWQLSMADYLPTIPKFWQNLYPNGGKGLYCGEIFGRFDRKYNIEHVFPMAWVTRHLGCGARQQCRRKSALFNRIEADMHNLYPARRDVNKARGAMAYGLLVGEKHVFNACDIEIDTHKRRIEPRPAVRGEIARAMLYMQQRYDLPLYQRQKRLLQQWHKQDPPDAFERWRNQQIKRLQGQANPWIR